jgi:plasmid stabilization system protein ParE
MTLLRRSALALPLSRGLNRSRRSPSSGFGSGDGEIVRALLHRNYYIVYRGDAQAGIVEVIRFWHAARDLGAVRTKDFEA